MKEAAGEIKGPVTASACGGRIRVNSKPKQTALAIKKSELPNLVLYPLKY